MREELSVRQSTILKYIVQEYIRTGRAVGSKTLIDRFELGVSPATVRNEMGELEERDLLQHPHTSAGRVPTDRGYRYYVEHLMDDTRLPASERIMIQHQFRQVGMQVDNWTKLAAAILAEVTGYLALATPPRGVIARLRHFELLSLRPSVALLIVVTQTGAVHERILALDENQEQHELSRLSQQLNPRLRNLSHGQIRARADELERFETLVAATIAESLQHAEQEAQSELYAEGLDRALLQPELAQHAVAQRLLELLRGGAILSALLPQLGIDEGVQVFIGSENISAELRSFGVIVGMYGTGNEVTGMLGVVGPTRMAYDRSISTVRYLTHVLNELLHIVYSIDQQN